MPLSLSHYEKMSSYIPIDLITLEGALTGLLVVLFFIILRYFLMVGVSYKVFVAWNKLGRALHDKRLPPGQIKSEIKWSIISSLVFAVSGLLIGVFWQLGLTRMYLGFKEFSLWYLPLSFLIYSAIHEVYFYFTHVWMHKPNLYKVIHAVHHKSVKTSPFASFSFHPLEALVHALFLPVMVLVVPIHPVVLIVYLIFMTMTAISNHLGVELIGSTIIRKFFISGEHHSIHHKKMRYNFGLYYTFMDRIMGTEAQSMETQNIITNLKRTYE